MKVTFVQPYYHNVWEALGIGYISAYCKRSYRSELNINFFQSYFDSDATIIKGCKDSDILAFSCTTPTVKHAIKLAKACKKNNPKLLTVMGGYHVTATKEVPPYIDQIVIGEGEAAFLDILNGNREKIIYGTKMDFKDLPMPDRKLIKNHRTIDLCEKMTGERIASFQSNRGCPMNCAYCSEICMSGKHNKKTNPIRTRNVEATLTEIVGYTCKYNLDKFKFVDPTFDISEEYVCHFCETKKMIRFGLPWECLIHAAFATEKMIRYLARANCTQINVGCESGSPKILKDIRKGVTRKKITQVFKWAKKYGVNARAFFILGMPNETDKDIAMTESLIEQIKPDVVGFTLLCPYPGSDFYSSKLKKINWAKTDEYSNDFWRNKQFSNKELKDIQKRLTKKYSNKLCERQK